MSWLSLPTVAQIAVERILNALPEGLLIALFAWALLRGLRRQNSGTRFAVWFLALLTVAALPLLGGFGGGRAVMTSGMAWGTARPAITIPGGWALFAILAWALGACVAMVRLTAGFWRLRGLRRSCTPIVAADLNPAVRKTLDAISADSIIIATSEDVRVPAAIGFWKRTIVLPAWALQELPPADLNVILLHEFAHLRRGDDWTNLIQKIVRALFFFHPAVWWIENQLSVEREMACDDAVLAETANPHGYATCLVSLLEKSMAHRLSDQRLTDKRWSMAQAAVHRAREAALRLAQILDTNRPVATRVWKPALGLIGVFSLACLAVLPYAPQFVAVDHGARANDSTYEYSAALSRPSFQSLASSNGEPGVPARLDTSPSPSAPLGASARQAGSRDARRSTRPPSVAGRQLVPARTVAARWNAASPAVQVIEASAGADQETVPQFRTLVFIEATQYVTSDSSLWRVQVWRVTLVTTVQERLARVPVANSI
jgi:hypothetical protein